MLKRIGINLVAATIVLVAIGLINAAWKHWFGFILIDEFLTGWFCASAGYVVYEIKCL